MESSSTVKKSDLEAFRKGLSDKSSLTLLKDGLSDLNLRKPISLEKNASSQAADIIQHQSSDSAEPELIRDKNVKIIKQTKNERLEGVAKEQEGKMDPKEEGSDDDEEFDRMSNDDLNQDRESPFLSKDKDETIDKDGNHWTTLYLNEKDWQSHTKFERWIVTDG